jgi:hypothetical protein
MISQTNHPIEVLALLLCSPTDAAQGNRAVHCAPDAFSPCSSHIPAGRSKSPGYGHLKLPHLMITGNGTEQR